MDHSDPDTKEWTHISFDLKCSGVPHLFADPNLKIFRRNLESQPAETKPASKSTSIVINKILDAREKKVHLVW